MRLAGNKLAPQGPGEKMMTKKEIEAVTLKAIEIWSNGHTSSNGWQSPVPVTDEQAEEAIDLARAWQHNPDWRPDGVDHCACIDDGGSHDVSSVHVYRCAGLSIYSYNNNAWGHCDVIEEPESACGDWSTVEPIADWLAGWDELPERWLADYCDRVT